MILCQQAMAKIKKLLRAFHRDLFDFFVDDALARSPRTRALTRRVVKRQKALRRIADDRIWRAYLDVEQAVNQRQDRHMAILLRRILLVTARNDV